MRPFLSGTFSLEKWDQIQNNHYLKKAKICPDRKTDALTYIHKTDKKNLLLK